jgi:hypothetical protein
MIRGLVVSLVAMAAFLAAAQPADASYILARNARDVSLKVNGKGMALVQFRAPAGGRVHVLAWGAVNRQLKFRLDYSGGWKSLGRPVWRNFRDASRRYDGPPLPWLRIARKAPDGSYWALQAWQRMLPNWGHTPWKPYQRVWELHLSHWKGAPAKLDIWLNWSYNGRFHHLFGRYTYQGRPVHGFGATSTGIPTDPYGRNVYVDTYNSAYGAGWKRENSFLTHRPNGNFCYGFYPHKSAYDGSMRPAGDGQRYRATVQGPGVSPDVGWGPVPGLPDYDAGNPEHVRHEQAMNALMHTFMVGDTAPTPCHD